MGKLAGLRLRSCDIVDHGSEDPGKWDISIPDNIAYSPLIAFVNPGSGGQMGEIVMKALSQLLHPHLIFNLKAGGPDPGYVFDV